MVRKRGLMMLPLIAAIAGCATPAVLLEPPESASMPPPAGKSMPLPVVAEPAYAYPDNLDAKP